MPYNLFVGQKSGKKVLFGKYKTIGKLRRDVYAYGLRAKNIEIKPIKRRK